VWSRALLVSHQCFPGVASLPRGHQPNGQGVSIPLLLHQPAARSLQRNSGAENLRWRADPPLRWSTAWRQGTAPIRQAFACAVLARPARHGVSVGGVNQWLTQIARGVPTRPTGCGTDGSSSSASSPVFGRWVNALGTSERGTDSFPST